MNTADILDRAADLIEERGHTKRVHTNPRGCLCAAGAMYAACGIEPVAGQYDAEQWPNFSLKASLPVIGAYEWFGRWLRLSGIKERDAVSWNDRKARTEEEVVSTLRAAAEAARAER